MRRFFFVAFDCAQPSRKNCGKRLLFRFVCTSGGGLQKAFFVCLNFFMHFYENIRCLYFAAHKKILRGSARI